MNQVELKKYLLSNNEAERQLLKLKDALSILEFGCNAMEYNDDNDIYTLKYDIINNHYPIFKDFIIMKSTRYMEVLKHKHDYIELIYVYSGSLKQTINDCDIMINQGEFCLLDAQCVHSLNYLDKDDIVINIILSKDFFYSIFELLHKDDIILQFIIDALYKKKSNRYIHFEVSQNKEITDIINRIICEYFDENGGSRTFIVGYFLVLFTLLCRDEESNFIEINIEDEVIAELNNYLKMNYKSASLHDVATYFHYNPSYMSNLIKQKTGKSFISFLQEYKLKEAHFMLQNSEKAIQTIVNEIGYSNISYFYKLFKRKYGSSPMEFRKKIN